MNNPFIEMCLRPKILSTLLNRARKEYWENLQPGTGRPYSSSLSKPDNWDVNRGDEMLKQHKERTTEEEMEAVLSLNVKSMAKN